MFSLGCNNEKVVEGGSKEVKMWGKEGFIHNPVRSSHLVLFPYETILSIRPVCLFGLTLRFSESETRHVHTPGKNDANFSCK